MDNPQTTEVAVANQFALVKGVSDNPRSLTFQGQDLFKIYSNYSYTCNVTMMGCAQIQPLMYFQLNNIPMFRGAYQIINVEHNITPGDMTTSFKGVRINRTKMPIVNNCFNVSTLLPSLTNEDDTKANDKEIMTIDLSEAIESSDNFNLPGINEFNVSAETFKTKELTDYIEFDTGKEEKFNQLNGSLRRLVYCIVNDIKNWNEKVNDGEIVSMYVTSATRESELSNNSSSDHLINGNPSYQRKKLKGPDVSGNTKSFAEMGCAIDFYAKKGGNVDKYDTTIKLFAMIATKYSEHIRQLIWETKENTSTQSNEISNCIHLASYGDKTCNDKQEIFVASLPNFNPIASKYLPPSFVDVLIKMKENNKNLRCLNLNKNFNEYNKSDLEKIYKEQIKYA